MFAIVAKMAMNLKIMFVSVLLEKQLVMLTFIVWAAELIPATAVIMRMIALYLLKTLKQQQ